MRMQQRFDGNVTTAMTLRASLVVLVFGVVAQTSFAAWNPYYVKQGDGAGGIVYRNGQIQLMTKPIVSPTGVQALGVRPFGLVEMSNGDLAMTIEMATTLTGGEPTITFSSDGGNSWSAFQSSGSFGMLANHGGSTLSTSGDGGAVKHFSTDFGQTWGPAVPMPTVNAFGWQAEGNSGVDRDLSGNATKIMEVGDGNGEASFPEGPFKSYYRESTDGGTTWTGAGGTGSETDPGAAWQYNSLDGFSMPVLRGTSEGSIVRADNGNLVAALRTDLPPVYYDGVNGPNAVTDDLEGTAISISSDNGATWSTMSVLYEAGRHHGNLQKMASGDLVLTMINRNDIRGSINGTSADLTTNMRGVDMLISTDNGATWDLDKRITLHETEFLDSNPNNWANAQVGHLATTVLSDGSLVTAYGSFLVDNGQVDQGRAATVLVKWDPSTATVLPLMDWGNNASGEGEGKDN